MKHLKSCVLLFLCLSLEILATTVTEKEKEELHRLEVQHNNSHTHVHDILQQRFTQGCSYKLIPDHPLNIHVSSKDVVIHFLNGRSWMQKSFYPTCNHSIGSVFLNDLKPASCFEQVDFEWLECGGNYKEVRPHPWKGQYYVFMCRESPKERKPLLPHWIDGGNGLCAIFPTNWTPPPLYLTEIEPIPLEKKKEHPLITSAISHSYTKIRMDVTNALIHRKISFHRFGSKDRTLTMNAYLHSFNSTPWLKPRFPSEHVEKENAIRWSKFHLAMEHVSQHSYMTEKIWQALRVGTVPIYYGSPEAAFFLPPRSTIFVKDFPNHDALIDHLLYLDKNDTAYLEYLKWKELLIDPTHPYTQFLSHYGQGEFLRDHFCVIDKKSASVLAQLKRDEEPEPFLTKWTNWITGETCVIPPGGCRNRVDFRDPPSIFHCVTNNTLFY